MFDHDDCRAYIDHVRLQFRHLHQMVDQLKVQLVEAYRLPVAREDARHLIADIADKFGAYVAEERGGGCLDEAVCRCPRLAPQEQEISLQYPRIQETIDTLRDLLADDTLDLRPGAGEAVESLAAALLKLETAERYLLREAFGSDESFSARR